MSKHFFIIICSLISMYCYSGQPSCNPREYAQLRKARQEHIAFIQYLHTTNQNEIWQLKASAQMTKPVDFSSFDGASNNQPLTNPSKRERFDMTTFSKVCNLQYPVETHDTTTSISQLQAQIRFFQGLIANLNYRWMSIQQEKERIAQRAIK